jgi:hypothetical protein
MSVVIASNLPAPPPTGNKDLDKWLENLVVSLQKNMTNTQKQMAQSVSMIGRLILPMPDNIEDDTATEWTFPLNNSTPIRVYKASISCKIPAIGTSPSVYISNVSGTSGARFALTLTAKQNGTGTGQVNVGINGTIYLRFTDCEQLGDGYLVVDYK